MQLNNPSLAMAANAYRRLYGEWPTQVRFSPYHFGHWATDLDADALVLLALVFDVLVTTNEESPRLTVSGRHGAVTYDEGVIEADWDPAPFDEWLVEQASKLRSAS
jgi:hypothetical protein